MMPSLSPPEYHLITFDHRQHNHLFAYAVNWLDINVVSLPGNIDEINRQAYFNHLMYMAWCEFLTNVLGGDQGGHFFPDGSARSFVPLSHGRGDRPPTVHIDDTSVAAQFFDLHYQPAISLEDIQATLSTQIYSAIDMATRGVIVPLNELRNGLETRHYHIEGIDVEFKYQARGALVLTAVADSERGLYGV